MATALKWSDILENKSLRGLPYKIETNGWGQIVMTPIYNPHGLLQGRIIGLLHQLIAGRGTAISESPIETSDGVKVADIAWTAEEFDQFKDIEPTFSRAPELCVEIHTPTIHPDVHEVKKTMYFEQGATEVWICDLKGQVNFYDANGEIQCSRLFPTFPKSVL